MKRYDMVVLLKISKRKYCGGNVGREDTNSINRHSIEGNNIQGSHHQSAKLSQRCINRKINATRIT